MMYRTAKGILNKKTYSKDCGDKISAKVVGLENQQFLFYCEKVYNNEKRINRRKLKVENLFFE